MLRQYTLDDLEEVGLHDPTVRAFLNIHKFRPEELPFEQMLYHMVVHLAAEKTSMTKRLIEAATMNPPRYILCSQEALDALKAKECPVLAGHLKVPNDSPLDPSEPELQCSDAHGG